MLRPAYLLALSLFAAVIAQVPSDQTKPADEAKESLSQSEGAVAIAGKKFEYRATAGTLPLKDDKGKRSASMFFIAYTRKDAPDASKRPITFCFNGGPGSSSVWLHLGAFGPRRVLMSDEGEALRPPTKLVENEWSILDLTDLVFIDPISTGYSRPAEPKDAKSFHGVEEDIQSVGEFIRLYTSRFERWASPKYLAGESYGTTRAAALAGHLQDQLGMRLNGVLLVSVVLNFQTVRFDEGNDLPYTLFLPGYAATAWYHKKLGKAAPAELSKVLEEAAAFAEKDYALALRKGSRLSSDERTAVAKKVAGLTGLSEGYVLRSNLRIGAHRFMRELLRDRGQTVGRFDSRLKGKDADDVGERPDYDPSYAAVQGPFTASLNAYVRGELKYKSDLPYEILTGRVREWSYGPGGTNRYLNVAPALRGAMTKNPSLRVFVASGYYDLATPYSATQYTFDHLGDRGLLDRVRMAYYESGHMMYIHKPSLKKLKADIAAFMEGGRRDTRSGVPKSESRSQK
jgi:carboxypeptidase C (cathepsin A)